MPNRLVPIRTFKAAGPDGRRYTLHHLSEQEWVPGRGWMEIVKRLKTSTGEDVNYLGERQYELVLSRQVLTSDDPTAP